MGKKKTVEEKLDKVSTENISAKRILKEHLPAAKLPPIYPVGTLVKYYVDGPSGPSTTGWILQNPNSPGGQTNSYLVGTGTMVWINGEQCQALARISHDQVIRQVATLSEIEV